MKVYVVTSGEYSDYHIAGVFIDRKMAEVYCAVQHDVDTWTDDYRVEEYDTDNYFLTVRPEAKLHYVVRIDPAAATEWDPDDVTVYPTFKTCRSFLFQKPYGWDPGYFEAVLDTNDIDKIQKIFYDWHAQKKAEEAGL